ncbi:MAG TPA: polysaccharide deacetylase family protein [Solirubrobacteraceae bacterium]|nr:polysaccharide deacetylase family protein [Solirubrobacteraceae bacterium]
MTSTDGPSDRDSPEAGACTVALTVTFDLEDSRGSPAQEPRYVEMGHRFLDFLQQRSIRATVFVVGELAAAAPELVRRVASDGHELGLHGLRHVTLEDVGREHLRRELEQGRALLEDAGGVAVGGFRAPIFSLTPASAWAVEEIAAAGFAYSSSVLPGRNPLHGWPGAPRRPFRWHNGLLELPCPVAGAGKLQVPFLGGIYMRYFPVALSRRLVRRAGRESILWSYVHPYDIDTDEPFSVMPHAGWVVSRIVHTRRGVTLGRLEAVLAAAGGAGRPLGEIAAELDPSRLPTMTAGEPRPGT